MVFGRFRPDEKKKEFKSRLQTLKEEVLNKQKDDSEFINRLLEEVDKKPVSDITKEYGKYINKIIKQLKNKYDIDIKI